MRHGQGTGSMTKTSLSIAALIAALGATGAAAQDACPIKVGVLHSLSGTMAISETTLKDTMLMLIEEQNAKGGLLGKQLEAVVVDLLPQEHRAALDDSCNDLNVIRVSLEDKSGKAGGHDAKAAKGRLARHLLERCSTGGQLRAALKGFRDERFVVRLD